MKLDSVMSLLESVAPLSLSDDFCKKYNLYDNSGIIVKCGEEANGALFSLDLSPEAVNAALEKGYNLIVTHHPAIYYGIKRINAADGFGFNQTALAACIKNGISVISMHLNFDAAPEGIDFHLMKGLGGDKAEKILATPEGGGYGRVYGVKKQLFSKYFGEVKKTFLSERAICFGGDREICRVASFCGAGCDDKAMQFAYENKADVFVSSDLKEHEIASLVSGGMNVIQLTHYSAENYGFNKIYESLKEKLHIPSAYFCDGGLL